MPGYVNYWYKKGKLPAHAKEKLNEYNKRIVHGIIVKNSLIFMHKLRHFPNSLRLSKLDPEHSPKFW